MPLLYWAALGWELPRLAPLWIAPRVEAALPPGRLGAVGFAEPSLMFLAGTGTEWLLPGQAAEALGSGEVATLLVGRPRPRCGAGRPRPPRAADPGGCGRARLQLFAGPVRGADAADRSTVRDLPMRIVDVREITQPIASPIRNAYIDFTKMTTSLVAVVTDQVRDGRTVVGYGFNSNGRYGQGGLIRERFAPRLLEAPADSLLDAAGLLDPHRAWAAMMSNEKPGGHGERSVAVGTHRHGAVGRAREARAEAAVPAAGGALRARGGSARIRLCGGRLLLSGQGSRARCGRRCAAISTAATPW